MNKKTKRILIVDDSATSREHLCYIINQADGLETIGTAKNGKEAIRLVKKLKPDLVTMDVNMPGMNGYDTTRKIMETYPVPIVIVSTTVNSKDTVDSFKIMDAGAVAAVEKPKGPGHPDSKGMVENLTNLLRLMSEIKVVRRKPKPVNHSIKHKSLIKEPAIPPGSIKSTRVVAIGASTGGPPAIKEILLKLPENFSFPILIVQHISPGFLPGMVKWLDSIIALPVKIPKNKGPLVKGSVYFSPDGYHMGINDKEEIVLNSQSSSNGIITSISHLFSSVSRIYEEKAVGILLTGMGKDGASGLLKMNQKGAFTIAQDKESSVVFGMPAEAIKINAATQILSLKQISNFLKYKQRNS